MIMCEQPRPFALQTRMRCKSETKNNVLCVCAIFGARGLLRSTRPVHLCFVLSVVTCLW
jgi:hypothetical protein